MHVSNISVLIQVIWARSSGARTFSFVRVEKVLLPVDELNHCNLVDSEPTPM